MSRSLKIVALLAVLAASWFFGLPKNDPSAPANAPGVERVESPAGSGAARSTWGRSETLSDHFARHGRDFNARSPDDYAAQAADFLRRAKIAGFPAKRDRDGTLRVFDWTSGAFAAYNRDGTTRTYFKPGNRDYFDRQPGERIDLRTAR